MTILAAAARPEFERIAFLIRRDGHDVARAWVERTVRIYETAVGDRHNHASDPAYRSLFERAIAEFRLWLRDDAVTHPTTDGPPKATAT